MLVSGFSDNQTFVMEQCYMKKRYVSLFETTKFSDCCFLVHNEKIFAHKLILATCSPVFEAMLFGALASSEVEIKDIAACDFKQMLTFIYTDSVQFTSVVNAWTLVYIAKKYMIDDFLHFCLMYIRNKLEAANVLLNYEFADLFNEENIRNICMNNVRMYAKFILNNDYHMKPSTLCNLLDQDEFNANEEDLIKATVKWAVVECEQQNIELTKDSVRNVLINCGVFSRIRFLSFPINELCDKFSELLKDDEINLLKSFKLYESPVHKDKLKSLNLCVNCNERNTIPLLQKMGFRRVLKNGDVFHANEESKLTTQMMVNKSVLVNGFLLPTRRPPETLISPNYIENLNITITEVVGKKVLHLSYVQTLAYGTVHTVKISEPFLFEEGRKYDVDIMWSSGYPQWTNEYTMQYFSPSLVNKDVEFEFHDPFDCGFIRGVTYYPF